MEANVQPSTTNILSFCDDFFNPESSHQIARQTGFIKRSTSRISGHEFLKVLVMPSNGLCGDSLDGLCIRMKEYNPKANISASALAQRINTKPAVTFIRTHFEKILKETRKKLDKQYSSLSGVLKNFNNVYIHDSTIFEINKTLARFFPGTKKRRKERRIIM